MRRKNLEVVALVYGANKAPVVSAKGQAELAQRIVDAAQAQGIYVAQDPALLAMLSRLDIEQEIPPQLYAAVSVILSWAYWLKGMEPGDEKKYL